MKCLPEITLLGPLSVRLENAQLPDIGARKHRALFARLAVRPGQPISRDGLIGLLWSETTQDKARHSLSQALYRLRRWLGPAAGCLAEDARGIRLDVPLGSVDVGRIEALALDADLEAMLAARPSQPGPFLQDIQLDETGWDDWLRPQRDTTHARMVQFYNRLSLCLTQTDRAEEAAAAARTGQIFDPHDEALHRALLQALDASGQTVAALRSHIAFRDNIRAEFGAGLSEETVAVASGLGLDASGRATPATRDDAAPAAMAGQGPPVIAVHPFAIQGEIPGRAYLGRALAGEIADQLGRFHCLTVQASDGVFDSSLRQSWDLGLTHRLGASHAILGEVHPSDRGIDLAVRLVELPLRRIIWSERYRGVSHDIFDVEEDVVGCIVATLFGRLIDDRVGDAGRRPTQSLDAYDCVLRGISVYRSGHLSAEEARDSLGWFDRAIDLDPTYARAHAWRACAAYALWPSQPKDVHIDRNMASVDAALSMDSSDSEAHRIKGILHAFRREHERADHHLRTARTLNPNDARLLIKSGLHRSFLGDCDAALQDASRARRRNPLHPDWYWRDLGIVLFNAGRHDQALNALVLSDAGRIVDHVYIAASLVLTGQIDAARHRVRQLKALQPETNVTWLRQALPFRCHRDERALDDLIECLSAAGLDR